MDHRELVDQLLDAWNRRAVADVLRLMDPQGSYYDGFWGESCSGRDLVRYFDTNFAGDSSWYEIEGELIDTPTGIVFRYGAYDRRNPETRKLQYHGAEILSVTDGIITSISDIYCDPDPVQLSLVADRMEERRKESRVAQLGLSARKTGAIVRRLSELADSTTVFLDPDLTARQLAEHADCTVAHLFHVLEIEKKSTFNQFVNAHRANYSASLLAETSDSADNIEQIALQSGFQDRETFDVVFQSIFGMSAEEYTQKIDQTADGPGLVDTTTTA